ncbi:MAG: diaminopimelate epimerase [Methanobacterium sp. BRmetb2]|nr:MAG: diaminopimelate epimerase [Methanobacterium sp. BRmetb2]
MSEEKFILFSKMQGLGNDYIVIDETKEEIIPENKKPEFVEETCQRGFSIGADGVIFVSPATVDEADIRFRIFNADGSEAEMCGNGIRCFAKFVYENGINLKERIKVETLAGIKIVENKLTGREVISSKVDMGTATFKTEEIPMISKLDEFIDQELPLNDKNIKLTAVNVGNPHTVTFTDNLKEVDLESLGPVIEMHEKFPQRINVHFVSITSRSEMKMITWERGTGVTMACGTGATASVIAGYRLGKLDNNVLVHLPGGELKIEVYEKDDTLGAYMEGDAVLSFEGVINVQI